MSPSGPTRPLASSPPAATRVEALEVFVELLSAMDADTRARDFYNRLCEAVCRLTSMERAALFLYDGSLRRVSPRGYHGVEPDELRGIDDTLEDAPMAQRALAEDRVVEVSDDIERAVPARYARLFGITTLTCTPLSAAGHWFGVIFADRGGGCFSLTAAERDTMWSVGKIAALAASARIATRQQDRARRLTERIDMAREIHESVIQRIFGISLVLGSEQDLTAAERARCREEANAALGELRTAISRPLAPVTRTTGTTLREELDRLSRLCAHPALAVEWEPRATVPVDLEPVVQTVLAEALRNAEKHAHPDAVRVRVSTQGENLELEVLNDGVTGEQADTHRGMGLRLAALEALQHGGVLEFGPGQSRGWRVRLIVPLGDGVS
jgi:signal transduction histidine kinase